MRRPYKDVSEDLRRLGLVLIGGAFLAKVDSVAYRILIAAFGILMLIGGYVISFRIGDDDDQRP